MSDNSGVNVANYMLESILKDLNFLKENNYLTNQVYTDVTSILPTRITVAAAADTINKPPSLPTRKSTHSINNNAPIPQPREMPKLPTRKTTPDWQQQQQQQQHHQPPQPLAMVMPKVESSSPPPPAYSQNPNHQESLATAEAIYDYDGEDPNTDLSFKQGEIIQVTEYVNDDWWKGSVNGKTGIFPQNHVKKISPPVKAKRPWAPPKPSSFNSPSLNNNTMPYSAPPPAASLYTPPPAQPPIQSYAQPTQYAQPSQYAQPQPVVVANSEEQQDGKVQNMAKKFGGHVATAATWGFGATLGSQAANAIF